MKASQIKKTMFLAFALFALLTTACDTGSNTTENNDSTTLGSNPSTTPNSTNPNTTPSSTSESDPKTQANEAVSQNDLIGTWHLLYTHIMSDKDDFDEDKDYTEYIGTKTHDEVIQFKEDGTFYSINTDIRDYSINDTSRNSELNSDACKGTYNITAEGMLTLTETEAKHSSTTPFAIDNLPTTEWSPAHSTNISLIAIIDGKLYQDVCTRSGTGNSLIGTWTVEYANDKSSELVWSKEKMVITKTDIIDTMYTKDSSGQYVQNPDNSDNYTYEKKDSTTITLSDGTGSRDIHYFLSGNYLIIFKEEVEGLTKQ